MVSGFWLNRRRHHSSQSSAAVEAQSPSAKGKPKKRIQTWRLASAKTTANMHHICTTVHMMAVSSCFSATRHWRVISLVASARSAQKDRDCLTRPWKSTSASFSKGPVKCQQSQRKRPLPVLQRLCHPCREDGP